MVGFLGSPDKRWKVSGRKGIGEMDQQSCETPGHKRNRRREHAIPFHSFDKAFGDLCGRKRLKPPAHRGLVSGEVGNTSAIHDAESGRGDGQCGRFRGAGTGKDEAQGWPGPPF